MVWINDHSASRRRVRRAKHALPCQFETHSEPCGKVHQFIGFDDGTLGWRCYEDSVACVFCDRKQKSITEIGPKNYVCRDCLFFRFDRGLPV